MQLNVLIMRLTTERMDGYAYLFLYVIENNEYFLKTIIPSRKATKKYIGGYDL